MGGISARDKFENFKKSEEWMKLIGTFSTRYK